MAGIEDAIRRYRTSSVKRGGAGLGSPQLSPELLKALQVPENKTLGDLFPAGVPGGSGTDYYDNTVKFFGGDPKNPRTELGKFFGNEVAKPILSLVEDSPKLFKALGGDRLGVFSGNPITDNIGDLLSKTPESTRQNLGQDILRQLSGEGRRQQGQLPMSEAEMARMGQGSGKYLDTRGQDVTDGVVDTSFDSDFDTDALIAEQGLDKKADEIAKDAVLAFQDDAEENSGQDLPLTEAQKKAQAQQSLFKSSMDEITNIYGDGTKKDTSRKTLDEYKADFAKATGIDVSGEPDNKLALMSLGLSLMQNKAGKDFNLSNIIGSAGEAGQAAMPLFQKAKDDARAGQVAAGKYALQETKADSLAKLATAKEKRKALSALSTQFRDEKFKRQLEYIKHNNNMEIKIAEANFKPIDAKGKVTTQTLQGNNFLKVDTAFITGSKNRVFLAPVQQAEKHANMYVNVLEAQGSITEMQNILKSVGQKGGGSAFSLLGGRVKEFLKPLGIGDTDYSKGIDEIVSDKNISAEAKVTAIQDRLISQYKKFLTKESGNGVSEGDIKRLELLVSRIKLGQPIDQNINRLEELRTIFDAPQRTLEGQFNSFSKRENFRNDEEYNKTMAIINKAISTGTDNTYSSSIKNGVFTIDLRKK